MASNNNNAPLEPVSEQRSVMEVGAGAALLVMAGPDVGHHWGDGFGEMPGFNRRSVQPEKNNAI